MTRLTHSDGTITTPRGAIVATVDPRRNAAVAAQRLGVSEALVAALQAGERAVELAAAWGLIRSHAATVAAGHTAGVGSLHTNRSDDHGND